MSIPPEVLAPRAVAVWLREAVERAAKAKAQASDRLVSDELRHALRHLQRAERRARALYKDADLRHAPESGLFDAPPPKE